MLGGFLLVSHTCLSARKIIGPLALRSELCVSDHMILLPGGGQPGSVLVTHSVTSHTGALKCCTEPMVSMYSKILEPNFSVSSFLLLFALIKPPDAGTYTTLASKAQAK